MDDDTNQNDPNKTIRLNTASFGATPSPSQSEVFRIPPGAGFKCELVKPFRCVYRPQPDITVYELAKVVGFMQSFHGDLPRNIETLWEELGDAKRHLPRESEHGIETQRP